MTDWYTQPESAYREAVRVKLGNSDLVLNPNVVARAHAVGESPADLVRWATKQEDPKTITEEALNKHRIRVLNYLARTAMGIASRVVQTQGINALPPDAQSTIRERVELYNEFTPENDPYGEHDFGMFTHDGSRIYWKIDYYDRAVKYGSEDPANPHVTTRVLTIMLAQEY